MMFYIVWTCRIDKATPYSLTISQLSLFYYTDLMCLNLLYPKTYNTCIHTYTHKKVSQMLSSMQITWPWPPVGRLCHDLITLSQKETWT